MGSPVKLVALLVGLSLLVGCTADTGDTEDSQIVADMDNLDTRLTILEAIVRAQTRQMTDLEGNGTGTHDLWSVENRLEEIVAELSDLRSCVNQAIQALEINSENYVLTLVPTC